MNIPPSEIKRSITGNGRASKGQVAFMVKENFKILKGRSNLSILQIHAVPSPTPRVTPKDKTLKV